MDSSSIGTTLFLNDKISLRSWLTNGDIGWGGVGDVMESGGGGRRFAGNETGC